MKSSLNHIYSVVWNASLGLWQVASEVARRGGKTQSEQRKNRKLRAAVSVLMMGMAAPGAVWAQQPLPQIPSSPLPTGGQVVGGQASISLSNTQSGKALNVHQTTDRAAIDWQSFSVGQGHSVNFQQPSASSVALNRVLGADVSVIQGAINSNGQVFLVNPNGVLFSPTAQVNVGGLVASTQNISTADFMAGKSTFSGNSTASVENQGTIKTADGGYVALIAARIVNSGQITAPQGQVLMGAGNTVTLDMGGPVKLQVTEGALNSAIEQSGGIRADGGVVYLTAKSASNLAASVINHSGITQAQSLSLGKDGQIALTADIVSHTGTLDASGIADNTSGGTIQLNAGLLIDSGTTRADGQLNGGSIVQSAHSIEQTSSARLSASGAMGDGGMVRLEGAPAKPNTNSNSTTDGNAQSGVTDSSPTPGGSIYASGQVSATGRRRGGLIVETAETVKLAGAMLDSSSTAADGQAGTLLIGGGWQGADATLANAKTTLVDGTTQLNNAGANGQVVIWSDETTQAGPVLKAAGSQVEISSKGTLSIDTRNLQAGNLLLDPKNIEIKDTPLLLNVTTIANPGGQPGDNIGSSVKQLNNGSFVVLAPNASLVTGGTTLSAVGRVSLYKQDGTLISALTGSQANDKVGLGSSLIFADGSALPGLYSLTNGHFVVLSSDWANGSATKAGAATWFNATSGVSGVVSASNSLVGTQANDRVGLNGILTLSNGNYLVQSNDWANGTVTKAGAVTWGSGTEGVKGIVGAGNSLVGQRTEDSAGLTVYTLANGNYVVAAPFRVVNSVVTTGSVTWADGTKGVSGIADATNSIVGTEIGKAVGSGGIYVLPNSNFLVYSTNVSEFSPTANVDFAGAVTFVNGAQGLKGTLSTSNSLFGFKMAVVSPPGLTYNTTLLSNGNFVLRSSATQLNIDGTTVHGLVWGSGTTGMATGFVSTSNIFIAKQSEGLAGASLTQLSNGNYAVYLPNYANGTATNAGAVTWGSGTAPLTGVLSSANSLVGTQANDSVGSGGVTPLSGGGYVVSSLNWANGTATKAGAVTWGSATTGVSGAVSALNSLVGTQANDSVGSSGISTLTNGNYLVRSQNWSNGTASQAGAVTFGTGTEGVKGEVSSTNSLVGSTRFDFVGNGNVTPLANGDFILGSAGWNNGTASRAGAITYGSGTTGLKGTIDSTNSLVGSFASDFVGSIVPTDLGQGNCNDPPFSAQFRPLIGTAQRVFSYPAPGEVSGCCKTESNQRSLGWRAGWSQIGDGARTAL